jgi:hypothetical protein
MPMSVRLICHDPKVTLFLCGPLAPGFAASLFGGLNLCVKVRAKTTGRGELLTLLA